MAGDANQQMGALTGILNWSLQHNDGTGAPKPVSEEDRKWFFEAMAAATVDPVARMKAIVAEVASTPTASLSTEQLEQRETMLEELKDHVEDIDQACDLSKVGGLPPLLSTIRGSPHARLRALAADIVATCCQNNPKAQQQFLDAGALDAVLLLARDDADPTARLKGLFATSALIRQNPAGQKAFRLGDGFGMLKRAMCDDMEPKIQRRAFILAKHLATSHDMHLDTMAQLGYIRAGASALASRSSDVREASLGMLLDIARHVNFERFPTAVDDFRHPMLVAGLGAIRTTLAKQTDEGERDASADERELADQLAAMLGTGK